jgi:hypothetical protein
MDRVEPLKLTVNAVSELTTVNTRPLINAPLSIERGLLTVPIITEETGSEAREESTVKELEKESTTFKQRGGRRPGAGRPLGSPNRLTRPLKELAALHSEDCIAVLVELRDHAEAEQVRLAAANSLLDRGYGRPRQELDVTQNEGLRVIVYGPSGDVRPALTEQVTDESETVDNS